MDKFGFIATPTYLFLTKMDDCLNIALISNLICGV